MNLLEEAVSIEMQRRTMCESDIKDGINYREVLNSRFESFYLHFQDDDYFCGAPARSIPSFDSKRSDSKVVSFANMRRRLMQKRFSFEQQFSCSQRGIAPGLVGIRDRSKREGRWFEFSQALEDDCEECAWFQRSLLLLGELCKSGNSYSQRLVTVLLPAEFLMAALQVIWF